MRLIVVGASGFLGRTICRCAEAAKHLVIGTASKEMNGFFPYDLRDKKTGAFKRLLESQLASDMMGVVLAAGKTNIRYCYENEAESHEINVVGAIRTLQLCHQLHIPTVYVSSDAVFNGEAGNYGETAEANPLCVYGKQKRTVENFLQANMPTALVYRLPKLVSAVPREQSLFSQFYRKYKQKQTIQCIEGVRFNPTAVEDAANCILYGLLHRLHGVYHVAAPCVYGMHELVRTFFSAGGVSDYSWEAVPMESLRFSEAKALDTSLDTSKFRQQAAIRFVSMHTLSQVFWENVRGNVECQ